MKTANVIVAGGGIGGLAAALSLQRAGMRVTVYEQAPELGEVGAGISISPNGALAIKSLGVIEQFRAVAYAPDFQAVRHYQSAKVLAHVQRGAVLENKYGERYYTVHRADIQRVLADAVRANDAQAIRTGFRAIEVVNEDTSATVKFENGQSATADAVIAADGVRSELRSKLFGRETVKFTGFVAWRGVVPMERVPREALDPPSAIFIGPGHMINRYPVKNGKFLNFVAFAERSGWEEEGWSIPADVAELKAEFAGWHPWVTSLIDAAPPENLFKWALCARSALMRWVSGRTALLGDAAHPLLPYLGQGAVMALEDAAVLGRAFAAGTDVPQALARYEAARVGRARLVVEQSTAAVPKMHSSQPENFKHDLPLDEELGLFTYDAGKVPV